MHCDVNWSSVRATASVELTLGLAETPASHSKVAEVAAVAEDPGAAVAVFFGYWAINGAFDTLIGPRVLGESLDVSPTVTILALLYWTWVLGPVGSLLGVLVGHRDRQPVAVRVVGQHQVRA